ncbi:MAG: M1 family metallopeptidase [Chloroflexota bacterium]
MKRFYASLLSLSLLLVSCTSPTPTATPPQPTQLPPNPLNTPWEDRAIFQNGLVQSQQHVLNELKGASIYHLEFNIADDIYHVTGTEEVRYTNNEAVALNEIQFRLFPNILGGEMKITDLQSDGQPVTPQYGLENSLMIVPLSKALEPKQSIILKMDFSVTVPQEVELNYGVLAYYEDVLALAHAYPMICVYDDQGWNAEIPPQDGDVTYADAVFYIVRVNAPKGLTLVTSGQRISSSEAGQVQTTFVASGPARDFYLAASPKYEEVSTTIDEVTIRSYAPKELKDGANMTLAVASQAIDIYGKRYASYPYTELDIVSTPTLALGIEYPGMIAITDRIYDVSDTNANRYMEATVAHEVGHQWFYNLVGDDQLDDPWLDESLTQFATLQYFTDLYGKEGAAGFQASLEGRWARVENAKIPIGLPVAGYQPGEYSAIVYGRGPLFFVALRDKIGTPVFDEFIKDYTQTLTWDIATPEIMQALAEKHCSCELDEIFADWVYP